MDSPNTFHQDNHRHYPVLDSGEPKLAHFGFTLIEIVVAIAILGLILSFGLLATMDSYRGYVFRSERSTLVSVLSRARNESLANIDQQAHGVCYDSTSHSYIIFRGGGYIASTANVVIAGNPGVNISAPASFFCNPGSGFTFTQLSGATTAVSSTYDIGIIQNNRTSTTSINYEGTINW